MPKTHRLTDCNDGGGCVDSIPQSSVFVNNLLQVVDGSLGTDHGVDPHCFHCWVTVQNTVKEPTNVFAENIPAGYETNVDSCGHARVVGSPNVYINSQGESGAIIDNNPPYNRPGAPPPPPNVQPSPPPAYSENTVAAEQIYQDNDDPDGTLAPPPADTQPRPTEEIQDDPEPAPEPPIPINVDCSTVDALPASFTWTSVAGSFSAFANSFQLSPNFTLADLTINTAVSHYPFTASPTQASGFTQKVIMKNLCFHAQAILEPMRSRYGVFTITSGFRQGSNGSQHNKGQATDIQFLNFHGASNTGAQYFARAQDYRDNLDYDQFILEWFANNPWLHISSNDAGHRRQVLTQTSSTGYAPGLKQLRP